jgi:hypothetical protein
MGKRKRSERSASLKYKIFIFSFEIIKDWFTTGIHLRNHYEIIEGGFPPDAEIVQVLKGDGLIPQDIKLLVKSDSFPEVEDIENIPGQPITVRMLETANV